MPLLTGLIRSDVLFLPPVLPDQSPDDEAYAERQIYRQRQAQFVVSRHEASLRDVMPALFRVIA